MAETLVKEKEIFRRWIPSADIRFEKRGDVEVMSFPASSEYEVERWYGTEILSHEAGAVRLGRATSGAMPLLFNHNTDDPRGMVIDGRLDKGRVVLDASVFANDRGKDLRAMIEGGLRNVSMGYRIHAVEETVKEQIYRATDWEPLEVSIVSVPADPTVGIGRSVQGEEYTFRMVTRSSHVPSREKPTVVITNIRSAIMTPEEIAAKEKEEADKRAANNISGVEAEKQRVTAIRQLCKTNKIARRAEDRWVYEGTPLYRVAEEMFDVMEERGKQKPAVAAELGLTGKETTKYSLFRAMRALRFGSQHPQYWAEAAFEVECSKAVAKQLNRTHGASFLVPAEVLTRPLDEAAAKRAMATTPGAKGGYLVNVTNMGFIDILRNPSVAVAAGARVLSGLQGNITFARQTGKPSVTWQGGEGTSITAADQTLGQLSMNPKTCIAITDVSEQLLQQSSPSAESFVMADLAADVAIDGADNAVINGTGGSQPLGIKNTTGITAGQDSGTATYAKILAFPTVAGGVNAIRGNPGWVTNIAGAAILMQRQRFTSTDTPLWQGNLLDGSVVGFNALSSEQLASGNLLFGSWDEVIIGEWGVLELAMDNGGTRFNTAQVGIRAMWMVDVLVRYPQAFVLSTNLS